jgi:hypothetical protein
MSKGHLIADVVTIIGTQDIVFVRLSGADLVYENKIKGIFLVTHRGHLERSNLNKKFLRDKIGGCNLVCSPVVSLYAVNNILAPKSQGSRAVCQTYRYTIIYPGKTPKHFFRFFGNQICASRTFTNFSNNLIHIKSEGRQGDESKISVTTRDIALFLKHSRSPKGKVFNIFSFIVNTDNLVSAWLEIKSNLNILTFESDFRRNILKNLPIHSFSRVSQSILNGSYFYKRARRVKISKVKSGHRFLTIFNFLDKIIQKAFHRVIEIVFEGFYEWVEVDQNMYYSYLPPKFNPTQSNRFRKNKKYFVKLWIVPGVFEYVSFGFRRNLSVHSAVQHIQLFWYPTSWFSSCDIEKVFDTINQHILINEFKLKVDDQRVENELWKMLRAKIISFTTQSELFLRIGGSQDSVLSSFFFNIFMNRFDKFCLKLIEKSVSFPSIEAKNPKHLRASKIAKYNCNINYEKKYMNKKKGSFYYIRYAEDLLFGFNMPKKKVVIMLRIMKIFLKSDLQLNVTSFYIRHACSDNTPFLGFFLRGYLDPTYSKNKTSEKFKRLKIRILRRHSLEYQRYLKLVECLGRKAILRSVGLLSRDRSHRLSKIALNKLLIKSLDKAPWFEKSFKVLNKSFNLAVFSRNKELNIRLEKWLNTCLALVGSPELLEFSKLVGGDVGNEIIKSRENLIRSLKKAFQPTLEKNSSVRQMNSFSCYPTSCSVKSSKNFDKIMIMAPKDVILTMLKDKGVISKNFSPIACSQLISQSELDIIEWFSCVARGLLSFYCCAHNFYEIKKIVIWQLKYSLFATLGQKYKKNITWAIREFGKIQPKWIVDNNIISKFPVNGWVNSLSQEFKANSFDFRDIVRIIKLKNRKYNQTVPLFTKCGIKSCVFKAEHIHHIKKLRRVHFASVCSGGGFTTKFSWSSTAIISICRDQKVPLCSACYAKIYKGGFYFSNLDDTFFNQVKTVKG